MADKKRGRAVDDGDERPDDVDDELEPLADDADDVDDVDDDLDDADDDDDLAADDDASAGEDDAPAKPRKKKVAAGAVARSKSQDTVRRGGGIFGKLARFVREIVAELQKVIWPTRKELLTYTTVVVVFVAVMMTFVSLLDVGFARVMFLVFGGSATPTK